MIFTYTGYSSSGNSSIERRKQDGCNMIFDLLPDEYIFVEDNADILCLDIMILIQQNKDDNIIKKVIDENPKAIILIHSLICHHDFVNDLCYNLPNKPSYLEGREWYLLHYTTVEKIVPWADKENYIYWDLRFDQYRFYTIMGKQNSPWEHRSLLYTKPNIQKSIRLKSFLIPNRNYPHLPDSEPRNLLSSFCNRPDIDTLAFYSNQPHNSALNFADNSFLTYFHGYEKLGGSRLIGVLEDPSISNYTIWNPITKEVEVHDPDLMPYELEKHYVNNKIHGWYYQNTYCSVYVESAWVRDPLPSEKTWAPLSQGHFILPMAGKGLISLLKKFGFKFPNFIDYSYDEIENPDERKMAWFNELNRISNFDLNFWRIQYEENNKLLIHNSDRFYKIPLQNPLEPILKKD